jgi:predicted alpha/beta-hydrolase family hydrolase
MAALATPTLIVQGERDALGARAEVAGYALSPAIRIAWMTDGDHSLKPRKASGVSEADNLAAAVEAVTAYVGGL